MQLMINQRRHQRAGSCVIASTHMRLPSQIDFSHHYQDSVVSTSTENHHRQVHTCIQGRLHLTRHSLVCDARFHERLRSVQQLHESIVVISLDIS